MWGPIALSGAGFIPLYATASSGVILHFLRNWRTPNEKIGQVLRALYAWSQMNAGTTFSLVEQPQRRVLHLHGTVLPYIRQYLTEINGVIRLDQTYIQPKLREHDISIMDIAIQMETLTGQQLSCINGVREWLNIMYVSEISTMDGKELLSGIDKGSPHSVQFYPTKHAPKHARPNRKSFRL